MDDEVVFHAPGRHLFAGTYRGKAGVGEFFGHLAQASDPGSTHIDLLHLLSGGDDHVVAIWRAHASRKGVTYSGIAGYIFRMRDGKIVEARNLQEDQEAIDRFWML
jgi:ketosteroid isomerase-like protein